MTNFYPITWSFTQIRAHESSRTVFWHPSPAGLDKFCSMLLNQNFSSNISPDEKWKLIFQTWKEKNNKLRSKEKKLELKQMELIWKNSKSTSKWKKMLERDDGRIFTFPSEFRAERSHQQIVCKFFVYCKYIFWLIIFLHFKTGGAVAEWSKELILIEKIYEHQKVQGSHLAWAILKKNFVGWISRLVARLEILNRDICGTCYKTDFTPFEL